VRDGRPVDGPRALERGRPANGPRGAGQDERHHQGCRQGSGDDRLVDERDDAPKARDDPPGFARNVACAWRPRIDRLIVVALDDVASRPVTARRAAAPVR
jgi:hypothetical protein